jgi:hypothetical protein
VQQGLQPALPAVCVCGGGCVVVPEGGARDGACCGVVASARKRLAAIEGRHRRRPRQAGRRATPATASGLLRLVATYCGLAKVSCVAAGHMRVPLHLRC